LTSSPERIYVRLNGYSFDSLHLLIVGVFSVWPTHLAIGLVLALRRVLAGGGVAAFEKSEGGFEVGVAEFVLVEDVLLLDVSGGVFPTEGILE
jgi:hypothetical protein